MKRKSKLFAGVLLAVVFLFSSFAFSVSAQAEKTGKVIIDAYNSAATKATEPAHKEGTMFSITDSAGWTDQTACKAAPNWTGAKYGLVYAHNMSAEEDGLGIMFNYNDDKHFTPKVGSFLYLDDLTEVAQVAVEDFGCYRMGIKIPAGFKGYVKFQLTDLTQYTRVWENPTETLTALDSILAINYSSKNNKVAIDTLTISYDDDMNTPLTLETALFGRTPLLAVDLTGKHIADGYDDTAYYTNFFKAVQSTEKGTPNLMYSPKRVDSGDSQWWSDELPNAEKADWTGVKYFMLYIDNQDKEAAQLSMAIHQGSALMRLTMGKTVYLDNGLTSVATQTGQANDTGFWYGLTIESGYKGYVKVPFVETNFDDRYDEGNRLSADAPIGKVSYNANSENFYVDTLSISYDDDIETVFNGTYEKEIAFDITGTEENGVKVIGNFYENNWKRDYYDKAPNGMAGANGSVIYSEIADSMTVAYTANCGVTMWGHDNQIQGGNRDFSSAKYFVNQVKNNVEAIAEYGLIVSNGDSNHSLREGITYYLRNENGVSTYVSRGSKLFIPANFDGYVIIPVAAYSEQLKLGEVTRFSLEFKGSTDGSMTFKNMGYANSDKILGNTEIITIDNSKYFILPPKIVLEKAPLRPSTEPEKAQDNNVKK